MENGSSVWLVRGAVVMNPDAVPGDPAPSQTWISKFVGAIVSFSG